MNSDDLVGLERQGWDALSQDGTTAATFYGEILDDPVVMLLPGGLVLSDRDDILATMSGRPWSSYRLEDPQVLRTTVDTGVVTYGVVARREGQPEYTALVGSLYVRRPGGWRLAFHQQTPR